MIKGLPASCVNHNIILAGFTKRPMFKNLEEHQPFVVA
jgi:hypothetical protein